MYGQGNYHPQFRPPPFQQSQLNPPPLFQQAPPGPQPLPIPHNPPHFLAQHPPPFPPRAPPQYQQNVPQPQQPGPYIRTLPIPPPIQGSSQVPPLYSQHNASYPPVHFSQPIPPLPRLFPPPPPPPHSQGQVLYRTPPGPPPPLHGIQHVRAPPPPLSSGFISVTPAPYAPSFPPMPPPPPPPPPSSPPPPPPSPPPPTSPTVERTGFLKVPSSSPLSHDILEAPVALADNETDISENKGPVAEEKASVNLSLPPPKPADEEVVRNIEVLCQSMVKDGPDFENIVRKEEEGNPQFAFLFGGESGSAAAIGHEYFQWMKKKYLLEKDLLKVSEQKKSPVHSDMDMEDDSDQTDACKAIDKLDKESTGEVISLGSELLAVKQTSPAPSATEKITAEADSILTCSASVLHDDEDDSNLPFIEDVSPVRASPNASELALDYSSQVFVSMPNDDSSRLKVSSTLAVSGIMEAPGVHVKDGSPFRLIQGYASDYSEDDDRKENKSSEDINSYRISPSNKILDLQDGKCNDKFEKCENFQKNNLVDDDNMNAKHQAGKHKLEEGVSDSESDEKQFSERNDKRDKRHRSESWSTKINDFGNYDRHDAAPSSELGKSATTEMDVGGTQNDPLKVTVKDDIGDIKVTERQQIEGALEAPSNLTEEERTKALLSSSQSLQDDSMLVQSSSSGSQPSQKIPPTNILEVQNFAQDSHQELLSCSLPSQAAQPPSSHPHMDEAPITQNSYLPSKEFSLPPGCPPSSHFPFENPRVQYTSEHHADYQTQPAPPSHFPSHQLAVASDYHSQGLSLLHTGWPNISPPPLRHNFNPMTRPYPPGEMTDPRRSFHLVEPSHQPPYMDIKRRPLSPIGIHLDHSSVREDSFSHPHMRNGPQIASDSQRDYHLRNHLFHRPPSYGLEVPLTSNDPPNSSEQDLFKPSLHKYPSSFLDKKPPHYNPYASIFEQVPSSSKFLSSFSGQDNNTNHSIKYDSSFSSGHILAGESRSRLTSSPPNLKGPGLHYQENNSKAYDPLFDSIEPSLKTIENAKKESTGAKTKLEVDELGEGATDAEAGAVENASPQLDEKDWSPAFQLDLGNAGAGEIEIDQGGSPGKNKNSKDSRSMRLFKIALADFVKEVLKPSWKQGNMSKESFKTIVKKTVEKVSGSMSSHQIPKSQAKINQYVESSQRKLTKLVMGYVDKYVKP